MKYVKDFLNSFIFPLLVVATLALFNLFSRLQALEFKQAQLEVAITTISTDIRIIKCAVVKDQLNCLGVNGGSSN